ncbi:MAG: SGNH/GDSL hydrolase family protein [Ferruginibacter sp.]
MKSNLLLFLLLSFLQAAAFSQETKDYAWWNPAKNDFPVIEGQAWPKEVKEPYDRLPARAEKTVRDHVWNLSHNSAGLLIRFMASTAEIVVRFKATGKLEMPHMPATGVSGVDLYAINSDGGWLWCAGKYSFGDTIQYNFSGLDPNDAYHNKGREYQLYLPLYNTVSWLEIGVPPGTLFTPLPARMEKPIVVYGTSIAQGGCASRPGMAWPAILGRKSGRPLVNLGFSGNGRLENELIALMTEIDAKIYVLDCLPNLVPPGTALEETKKLIIRSVSQLQEKRAAVPILLVEHCGYTDGSINERKRKTFTDINLIMKQAFAELQSKGVKNIYLLTMNEINLDLDCTVDGIHASDLGMLRYADAYEKKIRSILQEPVGIFSTTRPCIQYRDANTYDWATRHNELVTLNKITPPQIVFLGNSITNYWGGQPEAPHSWGTDSWNEFLQPLGVRNFGFGWDRIENVLWRVYHEELDGYSAKQIMIMIGTNNLELNSDKEIVEGLKMLVDAIKKRQPDAGILLIGILPRRDQEQRIARLNNDIAKLSAGLHIVYADAGKFLLKKEGKINESFFSDGLHPNAEGYQKLALRLKPYLKTPGQNELKN